MGSAGSIPENPNAPHKAEINFCGGWGYYQHAMETAGYIEENFPGQFKFELNSDEGISKRLDVKLYINGSTEAVMVHSKFKG